MDLHFKSVRSPCFNRSLSFFGMSMLKGPSSLFENIIHLIYVGISHLNSKIEEGIPQHDAALPLLKSLVHVRHKTTCIILLLELYARRVLLSRLRETKIYDKEMNLFLYLSPHSCHPPGVMCLIKGLIFRFAHRGCKSLCTNLDDRIPFIRKSYCRLLLARGHKSNIIRPIFLDAIKKVLENDPVIAIEPATMLPSNDLEPLYFHLKYNPSDPTSSQLQRAFKDTIVKPPDKLHISEVETHNQFRGLPDFDRTIVKQNRTNSCSKCKHNHFFCCLGHCLH